ncbi:hypothetical protein Plec18167_003095 [Paecilomyces lecythidis]|uniref:HEPN domain-containing protein n=1 Tax=Paecilomyces lecythidis TaxID=3004212 RepID=A0ABR3XZV3_9EURO
MADGDTDGRDVKRPGASPGYSPDAIEALERRLGQVEAAHKRLQFYCRYGDYAGRVFRSLTKAAQEAGFKLPSKVSKVAESLNEEASASSSGSDKVLDILDATIERLRSRGLELDLDMVKVAITAYTTRNLLCHSETGNSEVADDLDRLSRLIDRDQLDLPDALPDDETEHLDTWRKMLNFYRDFEEIDNVWRAGALLASRPNPGTDLKNAFFPGNIHPKDGKDSNASKIRRSQAASGPDSKDLNLKRMADGNLDSERMPKLARILGEARGTGMTKEEEEFKRRSEGLLEHLNGLYRKDPVEAHRILENCQREVRDKRASLDREVSPEPPTPQERHKQTLANKKNRRKAVVDGRKA